MKRVDEQRLTRHRDCRISAESSAGLGVVLLLLLLLLLMLLLLLVFHQSPTLPRGAAMHAMPVEVAEHATGAALIGGIGLKSDRICVPSRALSSENIGPTCSFHFKPCPSATSLLF